MSYFLLTGATGLLGNYLLRDLLANDILGLTASEVQPRVSRNSLSLTFVASEYARLRAYIERESKPTESQLFFLGPPNWAGYLQLEIAIGAHGAHVY